MSFKHIYGFGSIELLPKFADGVTAFGDTYKISLPFVPQISQKILAYNKEIPIKGRKYKFPTGVVKVVKVDITNAISETTIGLTSFVEYCNMMIDGNYPDGSAIANGTIIFPTFKYKLSTQDETFWSEEMYIDESFDLNSIKTNLEIGEKITLTFYSVDSTGHLNNRFATVYVVDKDNNNIADINGNLLVGF